MQRKYNFIFFFEALVMAALAIHIFFIVTKMPEHERGLMSERKQYQYPGSKFLPLVPYLNGHKMVGYVSDVPKGVNPFCSVEFAWPYQRAQYALSPVLLDYMGYSTHKHVILHYPDPIKRAAKIKEMGGRVLVDLKNGIVLIQR